MNCSSRSGYLRKWLFATIAFALLQDVFAQSAFLPDSISMIDARFFKSKAWRDTLATDDELNPNTVRAAIQYARMTRDVPLEALGNLVMAKTLLGHKKYTEAFDHLNSALRLDPLYPPLSPVKQYIYKEAGAFYSEFGTFVIALQYFRKAVDISLKRDPFPTVRLYSLYTNCAIFQQRCGFADSALFYCRKAIDVASKLGYYWEASGLNNYGIMLHKLGMRDSAKAVFQRSLATLKLRRPRDHEFLTSINDNLAEVYASEEKFEMALTLFDFKFRYWVGNFVNTRGVSPRIIESGIRSADMLIRIGRLPEARNRIAQVDSFFPLIPQRQSNPMKADLNKVKRELAARMGNLAEVVRLQEKMLELNDQQIADAEKDKIGKLENILLENTDRFQREIEIEKLKSEESSTRARFNKALASAVALAGLLTVTVVLVLYKRRIVLERFSREQELSRRELAESKLQNEQLERIRVDQQLELKRRDVTDYALAYSQRKKILDEVLDKLREMKKVQDPSEGLRELTVALKRQLKDDQHPLLESENIEKANHEFFEKLHEVCPGLTAGERDLTGLIRLNFSSKEISSYRNISPASVRISKVRLKKKLGLSREQDLIQFIQQL
jgi:tetratricopeptide (TPR) repeat protein/DNA-binding CsgD family transcriptional regulator